MLASCLHNGVMTLGEFSDGYGREASRRQCPRRTTETGSKLELPAPPRTVTAIPAKIGKIAGHPRLLPQTLE